MTPECGGGGSGGGSHRRQFLKATAAAGASLGILNQTDVLAQEKAAADAGSAVPKITLGKTAAKVTKLGMGTSWALSPSFVQAALAAGVGYIDTSESYENTVSEQVLGDVLERTGKRKDVFLVSKNAGYRRAAGANALEVFESHLDASLKRLKTDYLDAYYIHGIAGNQIGMLKDPSVRKAFETLKSKGKIKFAGLSCHDAMLVEILEVAAEVGWIDQVMIKYNFRDVNHDGLQRAIDKAAKANLGLVAMKTQGGAETLAATYNKILGQGLKKEVAAIKTVWADPRMHVVVSEMTTRSDLRENIAASKDPLTKKEAALLEEYRVKTAKMYCHGCGHLCETAAKGVPVATVLRYLKYYEVYGKRQAARELFQALPAEARGWVNDDLALAAAEAACPHGLPVAGLLRQANDRLA